MKFSKIVLAICLFFVVSAAHAQSAKLVDEMEAAHKECIKIKEDSIVCSRVFLAQMDSMLNVVYNEVKVATPADQKGALTEDQMSWSKKKAEFFKKQDETFVYNLQEATWKKDMIRITYRIKADYLLKRIRLLLKRLS